MAERSHQLGDVLNEAVRHKPSNDPATPKSAHLTYAEIFWDNLLARETQSSTMESFNRLMNFLLTQSKRDVRIERSIWFVCFVFGRQLDSQNHQQRSLANAFLGTLCDRSRCEYKTVRFRCCQCLRLSLDPLPDQSEIDEEVAATVYEALILRVHDRSYDVRTQALLALDRFKSPEGDTQSDAVVKLYVTVMQSDPHPNPRAAAMTCMPTTAAINVHICERTNDVSEIVRIAAFRMILSKIPPLEMSESWRGEIMRVGLKDRSDLVKRLAQETVIRWYDNTVHENVQELLKLFGSANADIVPAVVEAALHRRLQKVVSWSETAAMDMEVMTDWDVLCYRTLLCGFKKKADELGQTAATDADSAAASQALFDAIDRLLPLSLNAFVHPLETLLEDNRAMACRHSMQILIDCFNFTDKGDRQVIAQFFDRLARHRPSPDILDWYPTLMTLGRRIWPDVGEFIAAVLTPLQSFTESTESSDDAEARLMTTHWLKTSVEMLRVISLRTVDLFNLGTPSYTVRHLFQAYQSLAESMSDDDPLKHWVVEGIGICLTFQPPSDRHDFQFLWDTTEHQESSMSIAAIDALCTLAMTYGIRSIDGKRHPTVLPRPFPAIWECRLFDHDGEGSLPVHLMTMLHWEHNLNGELKVTAVQSLCKLLTLHVAHCSLGMHLGECIQCLCPLVALFVLDYDEDRDHNDKIQQLLKVFFDRYAQANVYHQYLFRAGFLPMLRYCLEMATAMGMSITPVVKFLGNLLLAPLHGRQLTEIEGRNLLKQRANLNTQLMLVLLWEIMACPTDVHASKAYIQSIWKLLIDLRIEDADELDRLPVLCLAEDSKIGRHLNEKQYTALKTKLGLPEGLKALDGEELNQLKSQLDGYVSQLGTHPFSDEED